MKKIVLNISDALYEKFRFEAISQRKSVPEVLTQSIYEKVFAPEVENAFSEWMEKNIVEMMSK